MRKHLEMRNHLTTQKPMFDSVKLCTPHNSNTNKSLGIKRNNQGYEMRVWYYYYCTKVSIIFEELDLYNYNFLNYLVILYQFHFTNNYYMTKFLPILLLAYGLAISTDNIYENSWALIIGIDKYQNVQGLDYAVKDAESIQNIIINSLDFSKDNITILKNEEATKSRVIQEFSNITKKAEVNCGP